MATKKKERKTVKGKVSRPALAIVDGDTWKGFYVDGKLKLEGHSLDLHDVLEQLGFKPQRIEADLDWLDTKGHMPEDLSEVKGNRRD